MIAEPPPAVEVVVVRAARLPDPVGDAAFSILRLDGDTLRAAPRLDEALATVPGLSLFRRNSSLGANPTTQGVSLRAIAGSGAGRALVTLDGVPQNDPFGGWVIWSGLPSLAIDSATVVRGAGAGPYGAGALTGVIALTARASAPGGIAGEGSIGSLGDYQGQAVVSSAVASGTLALSAAGEDSDGYVPVRAGRGPADQALSLRAWTAAARWAGDLGAVALTTRLAAFAEDRGSGLAGATSRASGAQASVGLARAPEGRAAGFQVQAWVDRSGLRNTSVAVSPDRATTTPANDQFATPTTGYGAGGALRWAGATGSVEIGADGRGADGESQEKFKYAGGHFTRLRFAGGSAFTGGAYLEAAQTRGPWLVTGGARLDGWLDTNAHRLEFDAATGAPTLSERTPDRGGVLPSARLAVRRELTADSHARAAAYAGFRPATLNELDRPFRVGADITQANPDLKPERLYGAEAGFGGAGVGWSWDATAFFNRLGDAVINATVRRGPFNDPAEGFVPAGGTLFQRRNIDHIDAWGLEASAARAWGRLDGRMAADYTRARVDGGAAAPGLTGLRPAQTPTLTLTAALGWRATPDLTVRGEARYETTRYDDDLNTRRLAPAASFGARADLRLGGPVTLFAAIDNLFDAAVQAGRTADGVVSYGPPRTARIGFTLQR